MRLLTTRRFERDLKKAGKRGRDTGKLERAVKLLLEGRPLPRPCVRIL